MYVASAPQRRPRKPAQPQAGQADSNRDSNALRASVLDAALAIGIGTSRTVENWMFNTVDEEDEEAETMFSPGLTSATSDESTPSPYTPVTPPIEHDVHQFIPPSPSKVFPVPPPPMQSPAVQPPLDHKQRNKLRKKAKDADGYISDDHARKAAKKKSKDTVNAESSADEGGGYFSDFGRRKKTRTKKKDKAQAQMAVEGAGDESDGGYLSEASKKKRGFFRLKSKSSKVSVASPLPPPVPSLPPAPSPSSLPIAGRFVKSPEPPIDDERSRSTTPLAHQRTNASVDSISSVDEPELDTPSTSLSGHIYTANPPDASPATKKGVRFTPSTRFSGPAPAPSAAATPSLDEMPPPQHLGLPPQRPYISDPRPLSPTRRFAPSPTTSDFSLVSQSDFVEPSTAYVVPSPSASPVPPPATLYDTSTVVDVPRPSHLRVNLPSPSRSRFSIPPPTPPPTGPLPDIPVSEGPAVTVYSPSPISASQPQPQEAFRFPPPPSAFSRSTSPLPRPGSASLLPRGASPSPSLFGQSIPPIARGRESPFPSRPILPQEESTALVRRTSVTHRRPMIAVEDEHGIIRTASLDDVGTARGRSLAGRSTTPYNSDDTSMRRDISHGVTYDPQPRARMHAPTVIPPNEDDVRSDVALFFFPPGKGEGEALSPYHSRIAPESVYSDSLVEGARTSFADDASVYPPTMKTRGTVDSYYFGGGTGSRPGSFIDDERSSELRSRFVNNVGRMWTDSSAPPVPALPKGVGPAF